MENKINVAELLKDCPNGMELDCTMFDNAKFIGVENYDEPICIRIGNGDLYFHLTKFGTWNFNDNAKCLIYPKGKTTWEGFVPPCKYKDGDIVVDDSGAIFFYRQIHPYYEEPYADFYCGVTSKLRSFVIKTGEAQRCGKISSIRYATEEEKQKLFDAIKAKGYKWNAETKTLEKLIEPKFKVGDRIRHKTHIRQGNAVTEIKDTHYILDDELALPFISQDEYELVPNKFDITTLKPFDKVLVRDGNKDKWNIDFFGYYRDDGTYQCMTFTKNQCIPYEVNQHLLGTTNDCDDFYKTWEK